MSNALLTELAKTPDPVDVGGINGELRGDVFGWPFCTSEMVAWREEVGDEEDNQRIQAALLRRGIRHKDGTPWFSDEDAEALAQDHANGPLVREMVNAIYQANGMTKADDEAIEKN